MPEQANLVTVKTLFVNVDDRGTVTELLRADDPDVKFGQVYAVESFAKGTIRGLHRHRKMWDWFIVTAGSGRFRFFDDNGNSQEVVTTSKQLQRIAVPPGIYHGWQSLEDNTVLISIASEPYMGYGRTGVKDEERVPHNKFDADGDGWAVLPR